MRAGTAHTPPKALSEKELRVLLNTPDEALKDVFPNHPRKWLRGQKHRALGSLPDDLRVNLDAERIRQEARRREADRLYRAVLAERDALVAKLSILEGVPEVAPREVRVDAKGKGGARREAAAVLQASDWHMEEVVTAEQTHGRNEYNPVIAKRRSDYFFKNSVKLVKKEAQNVDITAVVLWLGGDFFSGNIHEDVAASCALGPMDAIALVQDTLAGGIEYLLKELPTGTRLIIPCSVGNHSRITREQRIGTEHENSLEWFAYGNLQREFRGEPRVTFVRERVYETYVDLFGFVCRFHHGHAVKGGDNIGGLSVPLMKRIYKWNQGRKADHDFLGHFHTYNPSNAFTVNGSLIGDNPYGMRIGGHEAPVQAFSLIDSKFGLTVQTPILLEEA